MAMSGLTDLHQHILWGMDDGPDSAEGMHAMLEEAHAQQIKRIAATPHAYPGYHPFDQFLYRDRLDEAQDYCRAKGFDITLMPGAEVAWTYQSVMALRKRALPTLNDTDCVLIELWRDIPWQEVRSAAEQLLRAGFTPVFAHVERYRCFLWQPEKALKLKEELPVFYQVNAASVLDGGGPVFKRFIRRMLAEKGIDVIASDAHGNAIRPQRLLEAHQALTETCGAEYADALVNFSGVIK